MFELVECGPGGRERRGSLCIGNVCGRATTYLLALLHMGDGNRIAVDY
jgi:hypothetical protein